MLHDEAFFGEAGPVGMVGAFVFHQPITFLPPAHESHATHAQASMAPAECAHLSRPRQHLPRAAAMLLEWNFGNGLHSKGT